MTSTLPLDFASSAEEIQGHLAGGYQIRNPPMFGWLLWATQLLLGKGILSHMVLRYSLIVAVGMLYYAAVRQVCADRRLAAAMSFSLTLFVWFGWDFHYRVTHTLPMIVAGLITWILIVAWLERPSILRAVGIGLAIGLGLVSKWNFPLVVCGLASAIIINGQARKAFADRRALLIPLVSLLVLSPVAIWLVNVDADVFGKAQGALVAGSTSYLGHVAAVLNEFRKGYFLFLLPWIIFVAFEAWLAWRPTPSEPAVFDWRGRLALSTTLSATALFICVVFLVHISEKMGIRYMYPVLLLFPIAVAVWLSGKVDIGGFSSGLMTGALVFTVITLSARLVSFYIHDVPSSEADHQLAPYSALVEEIRLRDLGDSQFITENVRDAGNLITLLPDARAISMYSHRVQPPPPDLASDRNCIALWGGGSHSLVGEAHDPPPVPRNMEAIIPPDARIEDIVVPWSVPLHGRARQTIWRIVRIPIDSPACREARGL